MTTKKKKKIQSNSKKEGKGNFIHCFKTCFVFLDPSLLGVTYCFIDNWESENRLFVDWIFHEIVHDFVQDLRGDVVQGVAGGGLAMRD